MSKADRKEERKAVKGGVLYAIDSDEGINAAQSGLAFNLSKSGAGIFTQEEIREEDPVKVFNRNFASRPIRGCVRWCESIGNGLYRVGISFEDDEDES